MNRLKDAEQFLRPYHQVLYHSIIKTVEHKNPKVSLRVLDLISIQRPPTTGEEPFMKGGYRSRCQKILREFDLKTNPLVLDRIREKQINSCILRRNPDAEFLEPLLYV